MTFEIEIDVRGLGFLDSGMTGRMRKAVSLGVRDSLAIIERAHKGLFITGQSKDPKTHPHNIVWRTGLLAKSYMIGGIREKSLRGYYGSTLKRAKILEEGGTIEAKNAAYLKFRIGDQWVMVKSVKIKGRFLMKQIEQSKEVREKINGRMLKALLKGIDDAG